MLQKLEGKKTYAVAGVLVLAVIVEKGLGLDVPGLVITDDWGLVLMNALGLGTLRAGVAKIGR